MSHPTHPYPHRSRRRRLHPAAVVGIDILLIGLALVVYALFDHVLPQRLSADLSKTTRTVAAQTVEVAAASTQTASLPSSGTAADGEAGQAAAAAGGEANTGGGSAAAATDDSSAFAAGFAGEFATSETQMTDTSYVGENVNVTVRTVQSNGLTYYVEDIYVRDIEHLRTAFAGDAYGRAITDSVLAMAAANDAVAAVNGDYYGIGSAGAVIRNGVLYSPTADGDVCVLFRDGTMLIYGEQEFYADEAMAAGGWQAWDFGPALLTADGQAIQSFPGNRISGANPRTAIGYFEPGHYCFVVVDGRQPGYSNGITLAALASLMEDLGCTVAYNLDGGKSSNMTFQDSLVNQPTDGGREVTDIIYVAD